MSSSSSQIFYPFRAVGFCCNHVPLVVTSRGPDNYLFTAVGNAFHQYKCDKLQLLFVGVPQPEPLECLVTSDPRLVWASYGSVVKGFRRGREVTCFHGHKGNVTHLLPFGEHLISIDDQNSLKIWSVKNKELYGELYFDPKLFPISCIMHPSTYLNKILLGSKNGRLQLWNIHTNKLIYSFGGWSGSAVLTLVQSPAVDVVAAGLQDGGVVLHNLRYDETVMKFKQDWGPVAGLSFRTDGINTMVSSSPVGNVAVWDLDKRRLVSVIRDAHRGPITGLQFLPSQPLLVTSGSDNSIKVWIFDQSDGSARLLRSRCGHSAPPTRVRFWSRGGLGLLSSALDHTLRRLSIMRDIQSNTEFTQGSVVKKARAKGVKAESLKLPPIIDLATELSRAREWDSVVTCHTGFHSAVTWNIHNHTIGKHRLRSLHPTAKPLCVTITGCGNFCILGMSTGHVEMFNIQSGLHRGEFGKPHAHRSPVRGVGVNSINTEVYSGSGDSSISFWCFRKKERLASLKLASPVSSTIYQRESSLLAVACDNFSLLLVDTDTRRIVRVFRGHTNRITDMVFSPDSKWLISSSMDCSIRTWDLATSRLLDYFLVDAPPTSLSLSATSDFLATTHVDDLGIYLWSNKSLYSANTLQPLPKDFNPLTVELPTTRIDAVDEDEEDEDDGRGSTCEEMEEEKEEEEGDEKESTLSTLEEGFVTLSNLPKSHWSNLHNLDIIKKRNKPVEPPKEPKAAPFFLPTISGLTPKFIPESNEGDIPSVEAAAATRIVNLDKLEPLSPFQRTLEDCATSQNYNMIIEMIKGMSPSSIDREFRTLAPEAGGHTHSEGHLLTLLRALLHQLRTRRDFELTQAYLGLILKLHFRAISKSRELAAIAKELLEVQTTSWKQLQQDLNMAGCLLAYFKSATV